MRHHRTLDLSRSAGWLTAEPREISPAHWATAPAEELPATVTTAHELALVDALMSSVDELTPVEELVLDTLAARFRLGEARWTFDARLAPSLDSLVARGFIDVVGEPVGGTVLAGLTAAGRAVAMDETYMCATDSPCLDTAAEVDALADMAIVRGRDGVAWQKLLTVEGGRWFSSIADHANGPLTSGELVAFRGPVTVVSVPAV